jgi:hypothetical protein
MANLQSSIQRTPTKTGFFAKLYQLQVKKLSSMAE